MRRCWVQTDALVHWFLRVVQQQLPCGPVTSPAAGHKIPPQSAVIASIRFVLTTWLCLRIVCLWWGLVIISAADASIFFVLDLEGDHR